METENPKQSPLTSDVLTSKPAKEKFLQAVDKKGAESEQREAGGKFVDELQKEADARWPGPERDLWFNYHLTKTYAEANLWEYAQDAIEGLLMVAENMGQSDPAFEDLRQAILKKNPL